LNQELVDEVKEYFWEKYILQPPRTKLVPPDAKSPDFIEFSPGEYVIYTKGLNKGVVAHEITHYRYWGYSFYDALIAEIFMGKHFKNKARTLLSYIDDIIANLEMARQGDYIDDLADYYHDDVKSAEKISPINKVFLAFLTYKTGHDFGISPNELDKNLKKKIEELDKINWELDLNDRLGSAINILYNAGKILEDLVKEPEDEDLHKTKIKFDENEIPEIMDKVKRDYPNYSKIVEEYFNNKPELREQLDLWRYKNELSKYEIKIVGKHQFGKSGNIINGFKKWNGGEFDPINSLGVLPGELPGDPTVVEPMFKESLIYEKNEVDIPNAFIILDASSSMRGNFPMPQIVAAMLLAKEYLFNDRYVAVATFGSPGTTEVFDYSNNEMEVYRKLVRNPDGSTHLDLDKVENILWKKKGVDTYLITDSPGGGWDNLVDTLSLLNTQRSRGNEVWVFWVNPNGIPDIARSYKNINYVSIKNINDLVQLVINRERRF